MVTKTIQHLYSDYRTTTEYSPEYSLDFFSKNAVTFNNIKNFQDSSELNIYIELTWQYLYALYEKGRYNETVDHSIKHLQTIDREIERLNLSSIKNDWYYGIILFKGMASYRLRDYKISTLVFIQLTRIDAKNENYKNWLSYSRYGQRMWISKTIAILSGVLLLTEIFFKKYIPSFMVRISLDGIALAGFIGTLFYDYYIKRSFRKALRK